MHERKGKGRSRAEWDRGQIAVLLLKQAALFFARLHDLRCEVSFCRVACHVLVVNVRRGANGSWQIVDYVTGRIRLVHDLCRYENAAIYAAKVLSTFVSAR